MLWLFGLVSGSLTGVKTGWNVGGGPVLCACYTHNCMAYEEDYTEIREERNPIDRRGVVVGGCHT